MNKELSTDEILDIFNKVINWNPRNITLSGGEPMYRKDFKYLLSYLRKKYIGNIDLSTNALLINEDNVDWIVEWCDSFDISIDGVDEETCSLVRGKGVFDKVCRRIELIQSHCDKPISLSMVFSDKNDYLMPQFMKLNERLGTEAVCRGFSAVGRGESNKKLFTDNGDDEIYINSRFRSPDYKEAFGITTCTAGTREVFIRCDGLVQPCPSYMDKEYSYGNILESDSLDNLLKNVDWGKNLDNQYASSEYVSSHCKKCKVRLFCWTCPGEMKDIRTEKAMRKRCQIMKPILFKRVWEDDINM